MLFFAMIARNCNWHDSAINIPILLVYGQGQSDGLKLGYSPREWYRE
jgi:hypothetical protein